MFAGPSVTPGTRGRRGHTGGHTPLLPASARDLRFSLITALSEPQRSRCCSPSKTLMSKSTSSSSVSRGLRRSRLKSPQVSRATGMPSERSSRARLAAKSGKSVGSPPVRVTPPPESLSNGNSGRSSATISSGVILTPNRVTAPEGQDSAQVKQPRQRSASLCPGLVIACPGHLSTHLPQPMQRCGLKAISASAFQDSTFWHQMQRSGQPLKKTRLRMPGPS